MRRFVCSAIGGLGIIATGAGQDTFSLPVELRQLILGLAAPAPASADAAASLPLGEP